MADLTHLGTINPVEALDMTNYTVNKENTFRLPPAGVYTLMAPDSFPQAAFSRTKGNSLQVQIDPTIVGPTHEGTLVRFVKVSAKPFKRGDQTASVVGDYLAAHGFNGTLSNEQEIADAVEATAGQTYEAKLDWRAYNTRTKFTLEGMTRFPKLADGSYQSWIIDPAEEGLKDDQGRQRRVFANLTIPFGGFVKKD